jgi:hypothetical protein
MKNTPLPPHPPQTLSPEAQQIVALVQATAEELWDCAATILSVDSLDPDDWENVRRIVSHLLAALERETPTPWVRACARPQPVVESSHSS